MWINKNHTKYCEKKNIKKANTKTQNAWITHPFDKHYQTVTPKSKSNTMHLIDCYNVNYQNFYYATPLPMKFTLILKQYIITVYHVYLKMI